MLDSESTRTPHNTGTARRAGLVQRLQNSLGFDVEGSDNPDVDFSYSRREKIVLRIAAISLVAATVLGINYKEDRVQEHYDRDAPGHVDAGSNSGK
ncbi:hypothetical protein H6800_02220 [Candidatus Nomurabacteria bacterium]|nr:hypothetical protein [Candidatus Nomurabacteria bacterium]